MRLFAVSSATPRSSLGGRRERCASARSSRAVDSQASAPPQSPLSQQLTRQKPASASTRKSSRRSKTAVHPVDLRDLQSELDLLPQPEQCAPVPEKSCELQVPRAYTATISVLHALDLHNPCQIRSCPHAFSPFVELSTGIDNAPLLRVDAARHARNHSSWAKDSNVTHRLVSDNASQLHLLRVNVAAHCSRHSSEPACVSIGQSDDIPLSLDPSGTTVAQFYPVYRYQIVRNQWVKYFAGKVKLSISIVPDPLPPQVGAPEITTSCTAPIAQETPTDSSCEPPKCDVPPVARPSFLPANLGDALQLKRKQLKATVAPEVVNVALSKAHDDPAQTQALLERLQARARHHTFRIGDVHVMEAIGEGVHANVFRARIDGLSVDVAMKEFRYETAATGALPPLAVLQAFEQEYDMLCRASTLASEDTSQNHSAHLVSLVGVMLTPRLAIFTDYCSDGSLAHCLGKDEVWANVPLLSKLILGQHIASGLADLHRCNIVHRDIKTHNVMAQGLLGPTPVAKIGDFGSALVRRPSDEMLHDETGSSGYTAPEVFGPEGYHHRADIWSLGIVLWELLCRHETDTSGAPPCNPFLGSCGEEVMRKAERGERPTIPSDRLPPWCEALLRSCWALDPSQRPTAAEIASQFAANLPEGS